MTLLLALKIFFGVLFGVAFVGFIIWFGKFLVDTAADEFFGKESGDCAVSQWKFPSIIAGYTLGLTYVFILILDILF